MDYQIYDFEIWENVLHQLMNVKSVIFFIQFFFKNVINNFKKVIHFLNTNVNIYIYI